MDYGRTIQRLDSLGLASSTSVLDGVPFRIGSNFIPPSKVISPLDLQHHTHALEEEEYSFAIEMGVLDWAEERQRQKEAQREAEINQQANQIERFAQEKRDSETSEDIDPWVAESSKNRSQAAAFNTCPENESVKTWTNPLLAGLSNNILEPTRINKVNEDEKNKGESVKHSIDIALFDKEEDIFDNIEMQTIDVLGELKTVFGRSNTDNVDIKKMETRTVDQTVGEYVNDSVDQNLDARQNFDIKKEVVCEAELSQRNSAECDGVCVENGLQSKEGGGTHLDTVDAGEYVDLYQGNETDTVQALDLPNLPPDQIKAPFLLAQNPLPPISSNEVTNMAADSEISEAPVVNSADLNGQADSPRNKSLEYENVSIPNAFSGVKYSRHRMSPEPHSYVNMPSFQRNGFTDHLTSVIRNTRSTPDLPHYVSRESTEGKDFSPCPEILSDSPPKPPKPQLWNQCQPLPGIGQPINAPKPETDSSPDDFCSPSDLDPYTQMSLSSKAIVDHLVAMGFSKPRAARAVEKLGEDEKEAIEHLCLVDKLTDRGYNPYSAETALLLFDNNMRKAKSYLDIQQQFQTLGFSPEQIKEALITHNCDRDKALDYLTA